MENNAQNKENFQNSNDSRNKAPRRKFNKRKPQVKSEFEQEVIAINRVTKVVKGGRRMSFAALVVIGNKKGTIGLGTGKANEVRLAIEKAVDNATKSKINVKVVKGTIPHDVLGKHDAGKILLMPAAPGTGVKAGGAVRRVLTLAGVTDILSKSLGSRTKINMARATFAGLAELRTAQEIAKLRGKTLKEITD